MGPEAPFFMPRHFDNERALQAEIESVLGEAMPAADVLDVELDSPRETVRVYVDHPDGVGLDRCTEVTHLIRDTCPDFSLEVSSPGMERPLRRPEHFAAVIGQPVRLRQQDRHRASRVDVVSVDAAAGVTVRNPEGEERVVPFDEIVRCRLVVDDPFAAAAAHKSSQEEQA